MTFNDKDYKISPKALIEVIANCYCANVTKKQNEEFHEELAELTKFSHYVKDKIRIKPYVVIGNKLFEKFGGSKKEEKE
jgi:exonuclease III